MPSTPNNSTNSSTRFEHAFVLVRPHSFKNLAFRAGLRCALLRKEERHGLHSEFVGNARWSQVASPGRTRLHITYMRKHTIMKERNPEAANEKPRYEQPSKKSFINRVLASRTMTLTFTITSSILYLIAICSVATAIRRVTIQGHQRIVLLALGVLLPDFRHVLKMYTQAVQDLQRYKPPTFKGFRFGSKATKEAEHVREEPSDDHEGRPLVQQFNWKKQAEVVWLSEPMRKIREKIDVHAPKFDKFIANFSRDMTRPLIETRSQIRQLTTGTVLTMQKNIITAAAAVFLSLAGYFVSALGETSIGGVSIMLASLLANAVLAPRKHEVLTLIQDIRIGISLLGTLACVVSVFFPLCAAYFFLLCCVALVVTRIPFDWLLDL